jgi:hypothetical protein
LLLALVTVPKGALKLKHGAAVVHGVVPPVVGTDPVVAMLYPVVLTPVTFR